MLTEDFNYLIMSDVHISAGVDPRTNQLSANEDFLSDAAFAEFLRFHCQYANNQPAEASLPPWKLIINGDLFCFMSVTSYPAKDARTLSETTDRLLSGPAQPFYTLAEPTMRRQQATDWLQDAVAACNAMGSPTHSRIGQLAKRLIGAGQTLPAMKLWEFERLALETLILARNKAGKLPAKHRVYGMGTSWPETVWKLDRIAESHPIVFSALSWFVDQGNSVVVIKGNHDVEFYWPQVQARMKELLCDAHAQLDLPSVQWWTSQPLVPVSGNPVQFKETLSQQFEIKGWAYYVPGLMYVEHGNQYEILNAFDNFQAPTLRADPELIELPPGAFLGRYLTNKLEQIVPFIDNLRPFMRALGWAFRHRFFKISYAMIRHFRGLSKMLWNAFERLFIKREFNRMKQQLWRRGHFHEEDIEIMDDNLQSVLIVEAMQEVVDPPLDDEHINEIMEFAEEFRTRLVAKFQQFIKSIVLVVLVIGVPIAFSAVFLAGALLPLIGKVAGWVGSLDRPLLATLVSLIMITLTNMIIGSFLYSDKNFDYLDDSAKLLWERIFKHLHGQNGQISLRYIIHGHTHAPNIMSLNEDGAAPWYVNTGSWLYQVGEVEEWKRTPQDFTFLQIFPEQDSGWPRLLRWNDATGRPEPLYFYEYM